ncbi:MAG: aminotransferase class V-fold PLP-dependent enzyme [Rhodospirillales bacterium]|jgi:hypothetical protein|nr:aminotransferase class V-fold PLP-dependent enzyme [Rhodospirillales bacterium]
MGRFNTKIELYNHLSDTREKLFEEGKKIPKEIGMPSELLGKIGLSGMISECHGLLRKEISDAVEAGNRKVINSGTLDFEIRKLVKSYYGDDYDAVTASTCEGLLLAACDNLFTPPLAGRGENYRTRYMAPYERHAHHQAGYGRPFPPKYKDIFADRGVTAGEYGQMGKRLNNLDVVLVPMEGAKYNSHGLRYHPCALLTHVDAKATAERMAKTARRHEDSLAGFTSLGYTNPSYGYKDTDADGVPILQKEIAKMAQEYDVPYVIDNAAAIPFQCTDIRKIGADIITFSMDKASGATTCGLAIGKEAAISPLSRALGTAGPRAGGVISHGKAMFVQMDPGKESLLGLVAALRILLERGDQFRENCDIFHQIVVDEFSKIDQGLMDGVRIDKDYGSCGVEINYQDTWKDGRMGWPIFSIEDMYAGTSLPQSGMKAMGIIPCVAYDANIKMSIGLGTTDDEGNIIEDNTRWMVRALARFCELMCRHSGVMDQKGAVRNAAE